VSRLIRYFYPKSKICYFDDLKSRFFIILSFIGLSIFTISVFIEIVYLNNNTFISLFSKISAVIFLLISLYVLKEKGIKLAGNFLSAVLTIALLIWIIFLPESISPIYKYIQVFYSILGYLVISSLFATRIILFINTVLSLIATTHIYIFSITHQPENADFFTSGFVAHTIIIVLILLVLFYANKFLHHAINKITKESNLKEQKIQELETSEEEIRATNEELIVTSDALKESNDELTSTIKKLKDSEDKFKQFSDFTFEGILTHINGVTTEVNKSLVEMTGYTRDEIIGKNIIELVIPKQYHVDLIKNLSKDYASPIRVLGIKKDGTTIPIEIESKIADKDSSVRVVAIRDLTERIKYERQLELAKEKAEESDRLKKEFINNMSHEIRTPMNGILGFSQLLNIPNLKDKDRKYYSDIILDSCNQLLSIVDDIIEISKLGTKQVDVINKEVSLNNLLSELYSAFDDKAKEKDISLILKNGLADGQSNIFTDEAKLYKILNNLLENALKYTDKGFVEFGYNIKKTGNNKIVQLYVKDTGIGIEDEKQRKVFNRFSQAESELSRKYGGLGLGLSIAKENSALIGGEISIESEKGKGSTFFITIPFNRKP